MKEIKLSQGKITFVDDEDFEYLNQWRWHVKKDKNHKTCHAATLVQNTGEKQGIERLFIRSK